MAVLFVAAVALLHIGSAQNSDRKTRHLNPTQCFCECSWKYVLYTGTCKPPPSFQLQARLGSSNFLRNRRWSSKSLKLSPVGSSRGKINQSAFAEYEQEVPSVLKPLDRTKINNADDALFYMSPRFVTHVDAGFIAQLTELYRQRLRPGMRVLDLMSSWVSHLPEEMVFEHVEGHGLNLQELDRNPRLDHFWAQNLNKNPKLPLEDDSFDAVLCCVSVQYLQYPELVFSEVCRVLRPGGVVIVSFSDRMFYDKAIDIWKESGPRGRVILVKKYLRAAGAFSQPEVVQSSGAAGFFSPLLQMLNQFSLFDDIPNVDPFFALVAYKAQQGSTEAPQGAQ